MKERKMMLKTKKDERLMSIISCLPRCVGDEILRIGRSRAGGLCSLGEISLRVGGRCTLLCGGEKLSLLSTVSAEEMERTAERIMDGALYAHRDSLASGYITLPMGIRVGVCGSAGYEDGRLVGISKISSLLFRIPGDGCDFSDRLFDAYDGGIGSGMLIYAPPGVGKTTALRALAGHAGRGRDAVRVAVIDERCEFSEDDYVGAEVDILKGYKRRQGIEIATRTMSAGLIMLDELSAEDSEDIFEVIRCGVPIVATAHAGDIDELFCRSGISRLISSGAFNLLFGISRAEGGYLTRVDRR